MGESVALGVSETVIVFVTVLVGVEDGIEVAVDVPVGTKVEVEVSVGVNGGTAGKFGPKVIGWWHDIKNSIGSQTMVIKSSRFIVPSFPKYFKLYY